MEEAVMKIPTAEEKNWQIFVEMQCDDDLQLTKTAFYNQVAETFPVPLTHKLLFFAVDEDSPSSTRNCSAVLIQDMLLSNRLDTFPAYATMDKEFFRDNAVDLLLTHELGSPLQTTGKELSKKLVRWSLQYNDAWYEFRVYMHCAFEEDEKEALDSFISVFCEVEVDTLGIYMEDDDDLRRGLAEFLQPFLKDNSAKFHKLWIELLGQDADESKNYRGFQMLPFFHHIFDYQNHRSALMEAAIMSPFFNPPFQQKTLAAAIYLRVCIDNGREFRISQAMIRRLNSIVILLYNRSTPRARKEAKQLVITIIRRLEWSIPRNLRKRKRIRRLA